MREVITTNLHRNRTTGLEVNQDTSQDETECKSRASGHA